MTEIDAQSVPQPVSGLTQWQRLAGAFTKPSKTFEDIKAGNRSWWLPLIVFALVGYIFFAAVVTRIGMRQAVENQIHLSPKSEAQMAQLTPEQRERQMSISTAVTQGVFYAAPVFLLAIAAIVSLVLWGTINFAFGGKATFGSVFAVWFYASLPSIVKSLLGVVVIFAGMAPESFNLKNFAPTNLGAFLDPIETNKALYSLATSLDIVTIWSLVLMSIGVAIVAGVKRNSGYIAVFGWWAIIVLFSAGFAAIAG